MSALCWRVGVPVPFLVQALAGTLKAAKRKGIVEYAAPLLLYVSD